MGLVVLKTVTDFTKREGTLAISNSPTKSPMNVDP
jgi:hypothetical protein